MTKEDSIAFARKHVSENAAISFVRSGPYYRVLCPSRSSGISVIVDLSWVFADICESEIAIVSNVRCVRIRGGTFARLAEKFGTAVIGKAVRYSVQ